MYIQGYKSDEKQRYIKVYLFHINKTHAYNKLLKYIKNQSQSYSSTKCV